MGSIAPLFDTNIVIDFLLGVPDAGLELGRFSNHAISIISWMEVMAGTTDSDVDETRSVLSAFLCIPISSAVAERAAILRRGAKLKLPDAVIQATAQMTGRLLVTRNTRDFSIDDPGVRVPYQVELGVVEGRPRLSVAATR